MLLIKVPICRRAGNVVVDNRGELSDIYRYSPRAAAWGTSVIATVAFGCADWTEVSDGAAALRFSTRIS
jgi:hypothetical protein